jgi:hypothetical protein
MRARGPFIGRAAAVLIVVGLFAHPVEAQSLDALAKRVQVLEDREAIRALILAYGQAHDHRDYLYITPGESNTPTLVFLGRYLDQFVRENGEWKFLRREAPADIPAR